MHDLPSIRISRDASPIKQSEWAEIIKRDAELKRVDSLVGRNPMTNEEVTFPKPYSAQWLAHPKQLPVFFLYDSGNIICRWADHHVIEKANAIADSLGAQMVEITD